MTSFSTVRHCLTAALCLLTPLLSLAQDSARDNHDHLLRFEVPGSKATYPLAINEGGTVTGYYITKAGATSGFARHDDGQITTFDIPGIHLTEPVSINTAGDITGFYELSGSRPTQTSGLYPQRERNHHYLLERHPFRQPVLPSGRNQ